jgi:abortive infection bacteriophage resistance protein
MIFEAISFGTISMGFKFLIHPEYQGVCNKFGLNHQVLSSWIHAISYIRNLCAHHSRLWNRICTIKPIAANQHRADLLPNDRVYSQLAIMQIMLGKVSPNNHWAERLATIIDEHPAIPLALMGFPANWKQRPIWRLA